MWVAGTSNADFKSSLKAIFHNMFLSISIYLTRFKVNHWVNSPFSCEFLCLSALSTLWEAHLGGQQISQRKHWRLCALLRISLSLSHSPSCGMFLLSRRRIEGKECSTPLSSFPTDVPLCGNISMSDRLFKPMSWYQNKRRWGQISCPF